MEFTITCKKCDKENELDESDRDSSFGSIKVFTSEYSVTFVCVDCGQRKTFIHDN